MSESQILKAYIGILSELGLKEDRYKWLTALLKSSETGKGLSYSKLAELMGLGDPAIHDGSKQKIKRHIKALDKFHRDQNLTIIRRLLELGIEYYPVIESSQSGGGAGNIALFEINYHEISKDDQLIVNKPKAVNKGQVAYHLKEIDKLPRWGQLLGHISIPKERHHIYVITPLIVSLIYVLTSGYLIYTQSLIEVVVLTMTVYFIFKLLEPFYSVLNKGIIKAPDWLLPLVLDKAYLITRKVESKREIILSYYEGHCAICSGKLNVVMGEHEYKGRIIGQCENSGREHIFSFDHITKIGSPLRKEYSEFLKSEN